MAPVPEEINCPAVPIRVLPIAIAGPIEKHAQSPSYLRTAATPQVTGSIEPRPPAPADRLVRERPRRYLCA